MQTKTTVFPTNRAIKNYIDKNIHNNSILPNLIGIEEFFSKAKIVENKKEAMAYQRVLFLREAIKDVEFKKLGFSREFLKFIKDSRFIFKFFDELRGELVNFDSINLADTYSEYETHIKILEKLYLNYKDLLHKNGYFDQITIDNYTLNLNFLKDRDFLLKIDGYLTNFELQLIDNISKVTNIEIEIDIDELNSKMVEKLKNYGFNLEVGYKYLINFSTKEIVKFSNLSIDISNTTLISFPDRLSQAEYIFKLLHQFIEIEQIEPEKIALVLPDDSFVDILKLFDDNRNLNFAMGESFINSEFYKKLNTIYHYSIYRDKKDFETLKVLNIVEIANLYINRFSENGFLLFEEFLNSIGVSDEIVLNELYKLSKFKDYLNSYTLKELIFFFLQNLKELSISDVGGGRVRVIGVLESRMVEFERVIIPDFNDGYVPKISEKELFLNSEIKSISLLPTSSDREALQKQLYKKLISNSKKSVITFVKSNLQMGSKFINELNLKEIEGEKISLFEDKNINRWDKDIVDLDSNYLDKPLSATKLKTFLDCKRKFYFRYIKNIKEENFNIENSAFSGVVIHQALCEIYQQKEHYESVEELRDKLIKAIKNIKKTNIERFDLDLFIYNFEPFLLNEVTRFKKGFKVIGVEKEFNVTLSDINLVGKIDRVDRLNGKLTLIDYKFQNSLKIDSEKTLENSKDFQFAFYYYGAKDLYSQDIEEALFYDLKNQKIEIEQTLIQKVELLKVKIEEYKKFDRVYKKAEKIDVCRFCPYKTICNSG